LESDTVLSKVDVDLLTGTNLTMKMRDRSIVVITERCGGEALLFLSLYLESKSTFLCFSHLPITTPLCLSHPDETTIPQGKRGVHTDYFQTLPKSCRVCYTETK